MKSSTMDAMAREYAAQFPAMFAAWAAMSRQPLPRNARALDQLQPKDYLAISFVGNTPLRMPTVYADSGKRYDLRRAQGAHVFIVVKPGIDAKRVIADVFEVGELYPTLVDYETKTVAAIVDKVGGGFKLWPWARGSEPWRAYFE